MRLYRTFFKLGLIFFALSSLPDICAEPLFPMTSAAEQGTWSRDQNFSVELKVGVDSAHLGGTFRYFFASHLGVEIDGDFAGNTKAASLRETHYSLSIPFRLWSAEGWFVAPMLGLGREASTLIYPVGLQAYLNVGDFNFWMNGTIKYGLPTLTEETSFQVDYPLYHSKSFLSFLGLRYEMLATERAESQAFTSLVSGSRF